VLQPGCWAINRWQFGTAAIRYIICSMIGLLSNTQNYIDRWSLPVFVVEVSVSNRSEISGVHTSSPAHQHHVSPSHLNVSSNHQSPVHQTVSPVHQPPATVSVTPVFSSSSPSRHRPSLTPAATTTVPDPATCPIIPGHETTIEINKGKSGLGLSIVGGSDTLLVCAFVILIIGCID